MSTRSQETLPIRVNTLTYDGRRLPRFEPNRVCEAPGCMTVLSVYNRTARCWQHEVPHDYVPMKGRRSNADRRLGLG